MKTGEEVGRNEKASSAAVREIKMEKGREKRQGEKEKGEERNYEVCGEKERWRDEGRGEERELKVRHKGVRTVQRRREEKKT